MSKCSEMTQFLSNSLKKSLKSRDSPPSGSKTRTRNSSTCDKIPWSRFYPKKTLLKHQFVAAQKPSAGKWIHPEESYVGNIFMAC